MKRIYKKLNNTRGASILFALLVFMICAFAGAAALTAAAANAGRFSHAEEDQRKYLSVASATNLLLEELSAPKLEISRAREETRTWTYDDSNNLASPPETTYGAPGDTVATWYNGDTKLDDTYHSMLKELVEAYCKGLFEAEIVPADWYKPGTPPDIPAFQAKKLTITGDSDMKNLVNVYAIVSLDPESYALTIRLWAGDDPDSLEDGEAAEDDLRKAYETEILLPARTSANIESTVVENSGSGSTGWTITETRVVYTLEWPIDGALIIRN